MSDNIAAVRQAWPDLLDTVREHSRATYVLLSNSTVTTTKDNTLVLNLPTAPIARRLSEDENVEIIRQALQTVLGGNWHWQVRCEHTQ